MKKNLICMITCFMLATSAANAFATKFSFDVPEDINVDMSQAYINGEYTMIPLRSTAENFGYEVLWHDEEMNMCVKNDNVNIKIYIGQDSYYVESSDNLTMSNPVMVGAAPELKDNKTYVPAVMINMLRHYDSLSAAE